MLRGSRKHRPPTQPLTKETANPNAATAAASAFMRREPPAPSLSSAAAAAALKARPTTPINVAEVQSKRALRRTPSVGSTNSRARTPERTHRRELQRSPSVGSMTERTFRSPSPGRNPAPRQPDVPPVPSLPKTEHIATRTKQAPPPQRNASTMQTQPFRTASQKLQDGQQGSSWFGAATANNLDNVRKSDAVLHSSPVVPSSSHDQRPGSVSPSINFSYPRSQLDSPDRPLSTSISDQTMVYDANSRRMVPRRDLVPATESVRLIDRPTTKKKQEVSRSGSHLSKGTIARTSAPALEALQTSTTQSRQVPPPVSVPEPSIESSRNQTSTHESVPPVSREQTLVDPDADIEVPDKLDLRVSDGATVLPPPDAPDAPVLGDAPFTVEEEPQLEEQSVPEHYDSSHAHVPEAIDSAPIGSSLAADAQPEGRSADVEDTYQEAKEDEMPQTAETKQYGSIRGARVHSESPARTARFAPTPDQLAIKHEPPPRSLSPRKSAMKSGSQASPARGVSPSDDSSEASGLGVNNLREETAAARKKRVRVSFDDQKTVILGESDPKPETDSPIIPSPQAVKKPWHSIVGRYTKKDSAALEDDETMTPRPALPLFGSVREKKTKDTEERPLVRPSERAWSPLPSAMARSSSPANLVEEDLGQSSDAGVGSALAMDQASKNEANISKYREPLPPVVTSMEGSGYVSHSDLSSDEELEFDDVEVPDEPAPLPMPEVSDAVPDDHVPDQEEMTEAETKQSEHVPNISITLPTPLVQPGKEPGTESVPAPERSYFGIPGGFPEEDSTETIEELSSPSTDRTNSPPVILPPKPEVKLQDPPIEPDIRKPEISEVELQDPPTETAPREPEPSTPTRPIEPVQNTTPTLIMMDIQEEEEDGSSIYSDAYEELSDVDGDGFLSLDAILTTPIKAKVNQKLFEKTMSHAEENHHPMTSPVDPTTTTSAKGTQGAPIETQDDWDKAKAYWRSLSSDKRRQLEKEATEEAGEEADLEEERKPKKKTKRRSVNTSEPVAAAAPAAEAPLDQHRVYQIQPGTKWTDQGSTPKTTPKGSGGGKLRKSMRGAPPPPEKHVSQTQAGGMRKSLRAGAPPAAAPYTGEQSDGHMRKSLRADPEITATPGAGMRKSLRSNGSAVDSLAQRPSVKTTGRPVSYQPTPAEAVEAHKRNHSADPQRPSTAIAAGTMKPSLRRRGSDSSESSFTRVRANRGQGFGFKSSMRGSMRDSAPAPDTGRSNARFSLREPVAAPDTTKGSGRFSLRSLSPSGSTFRRNSNTTSPPQMGLGGLRQSMRSGSVDAGASRKRFSGLGLSSKKDKPKPKANRFGNSSDEEEIPVSFRSRFGDSSDEEEAPRPQSVGKGMNRTMRSNKSSNSAAAAAMGKPAPRIRSESPELPDSDDEVVPPTRPATSSGLPAGRQGPGLQRSRSGRGSLVTSPTPGAIATQGVGSNRPANNRRGSFMSILRRKKDPAGKISREVTESAARRDTKLERSAEQLTMIRSASSSRLQKRGPNWPLPDGANNEPEEPTDPPVDEEKRPSTSAGPTSHPPPPTRTGFLRRHSTSQSVAVTDSVADDTPGTPKKKKFGTLRKMFKLGD